MKWNLFFKNPADAWNCISVLKSSQLILWALYVIQCFLCYVKILDSWDITCHRVAFIYPVPSATMDLWHMSQSFFFSSFLSLLCCFFCCSFLTQNLFSFSRKKHHGILFCISLYIFTIQSLVLRFLFMSAFLF